MGLRGPTSYLLQPQSNPNMVCVYIYIYTCAVPIKPKKGGADTQDVTSLLVKTRLELVVFHTRRPVSQSGPQRSHLRRTWNRISSASSVTSFHVSTCIEALQAYSGSTDVSARVISRRWEITRASTFRAIPMLSIRPFNSAFKAETRGEPQHTCEMLVGR